MKIASKFGPSCPSCNRKLPTATFGPGFDSPWGCLACGDTVCCWCYWVHTEEAHPDLGETAVVFPEE